MTRSDTVRKALRTNRGKSIRAEDLEEYDEFFVDTGDLASIESNANQLIYGRRGSGKTLLLGALNERIQGQFPSARIMSFYYDATQFRSSADYGGHSASIKEKTHAFFHAFIESLAHDMFDFADAVLEKSSWRDALTLGGDKHARRRERLSNLVLELLEASGYGADNPLPDAKKTAQGNVAEKQRGKGGHGRLGFRLDTTSANPASISLGAEIGSASQDRSKGFEATETTPGRYFRPHRVSELLVEIIELLNLEYVVIFIDEWMTLAECQVEFAERLKQCLFGHKRIAVKIAADQYQGEFHNSGRGHHLRGLEVGGDIFVAADLDKPFRDPDNSPDLFAEALYRRLYFF
jgi:hypothetical protein